jgi:hypothetical protein
MLREQRVQELCESNYQMLKDAYGSVRELKGLVERLHVMSLKGPAVDFDCLAAVKLTTDRLYDSLERYLRPECDPDSALEEAMTESPQS